MKKLKKLFLASTLFITSFAGILTARKLVNNTNKVNAEIPVGCVLDESIDEVSVKDLTMNKLTGQSMIYKSVNATYSKESANGSLIFKFKYDVKDTTNKDSNSFRIRFDVNNGNYTEDNALWIRGDHTFIKLWNGSSLSWDQHSALTAGVHEMEFGRVAILNESDSTPTGSYYVYYKDNGALKASSNVEYTAANIGNNIFFDVGETNKSNYAYDASVSYENPQYVSISDLNGVTGTSINAVGQNYVYDTSNASANKSTVFTFNLNYKQNVDGEEGSQINIYGVNGKEWDFAGYIWIQKTQVAYGVNNEDGSFKTNDSSSYPALEVGKTYPVEYGRLAIMNGDTFSGKYHVYFKLNGLKVFGIDQAINSDCSTGGKIRISGKGEYDFEDAYTYETPKTISVGDLVKGSQTLGNTYTITEDSDFTFDNSDHTPNYSLVFKFKYTPNSSKENQFHLWGTNKWDYANCLILNRNGNEFYLGSGASVVSGGTYEMTPGTTYDIEYGRKAIMLNGIFMDKYYNYVSINGTIIKSAVFASNSVPEVELTSNNLFVSYSTDTTAAVMQDCNPSVYEEADVISVSDLIGAGSVITLTSSPKFNYTATAEHKSVVFKFDYEVADPKSVDCQFIFNDGWYQKINDKEHGGIIWLKGDNSGNHKVFMYLDGGKVDDKQSPITSAGTYSIEIGKLYISNGRNAGKYVLYAKINDQTIVNNVIGDPMPDKASIFFTGKNGDKLHDVYTYEEAKVISVSDLYNNGMIGSSQVLDDRGGAKEYRFANEDHTENYSIKFKFKYNVESTSESHQFYLSNENWLHPGSFLLKSTQLCIGKEDEGYFNYDTPLTSGLHDIEYGREAILVSGEFTGKYHVYLMVDGTIVLQSNQVLSNTLVSDNHLFITGDAGAVNTMYDEDYVFAPTYEEADVISVYDLKAEGYNLRDSIPLIEQQAYSYDATAEHKSVVFKFTYEVVNTEFLSCQIHFYDGWLPGIELVPQELDEHGNPKTRTHDGMIWLRNDRTFISKSTESSGYKQGNNPFTSVGFYDVEVGKIYIASGEGAGKWHIYIKVDGELIVETVADDAMPNSANVFFTGTDGNIVHDVNYMDIDVSTGLYLHRWNINDSGIQFTATLNKAFVDYKDVSEVGFILVPTDKLTGSLNINSNYDEMYKVVGKLVPNGANYEVKAALASLKDENVSRYYSAVAYVKMPNAVGEGSVYCYSDIYQDSLLNALNNEVQEPTDEIFELRNRISGMVLSFGLSDTNLSDYFDVTGECGSDTIILTKKESAKDYKVFECGGILRNGSKVKYGLLTYEVTLSDEAITLTKQYAPSLSFGGSEHFHETNSGIVETSNASTLAPMTSNLGTTTIRLDVSFADLFDVLEGDQLRVNVGYQLRVQSVIDELKANGGINEFLAVVWTVQPYGCYKGGEGLPWASRTAPNPSNENEEYLRWLDINSRALAMTARLFPDIRAYEPWNEPEMMGGADCPLCKQDGTDFTVAEKAKILTDLMYHMNMAVKSVNGNIILTTPSICCSQKAINQFAVTSPAFLEALYAAIEDAVPVPGLYSGYEGKDPNVFFDVINIHPYALEGLGTTVANWKSFVEGFYTIATEHDDEYTEIWITEFGFTPANGNEDNMELILADAVTIAPLTRLYFYLIHDDLVDDQSWGLYNVDGTIKNMGTVVKEFIAEYNA